VSLTDPLARSFFDLWQHLDPVQAGRFDPAAGPPGLAVFDDEIVRQHLAALRALGLAAEELEPETLDDQIDLTLLLGAIREVERTFGQERSHRAGPGFWLVRLAETLAARAGDGELLDLVPAWAESAVVPSDAFGLETGLTVLEAVGMLLEDELWARAPADRLARARAALEGLGQSLRAEARPSDEVPASGIGEEAADWRLNYVYSLSAGSAAALRQLAALADQLEADLVRGAAAVDPARPWREIVAGLGFGPLAYTDPDAPMLEAWAAFRDPTEPEAHFRVAPGGALEPGRSRLCLRPGSPLAVARGVRYGPAGAGGLVAGRVEAASEIRRRYAQPGLLDGWGLFAEDRAARATQAPALALVLQADLLLRTLMAAADLAVHRRQLTLAEVPERLTTRALIAPEAAVAEARRIALAPLEAAGSVLVWREWVRLAAAWPGGDPALEAAVRAGGLASPVLVRWRHDVPE